MFFSSEPGRTPLPNPQFFILICIRFIEPISFTMLFPFVYFMVRDFDPAMDSRLIGYYAGLLSASFAVGEFLSGLPWGLLSDRIGRKPVMMMGLFGTTISMFLFGISKSLTWALVTRFMAGSLNGNVGVLRTMVGEITDRTNRADAFSYVALTFGIGLIVGPVLGGFLTNPVVKFPWLFGNVHFLKEYPYFLPCGISSLLCAFGFVLTYFFIEETLGCEQPQLEISERDVTAPLLQASSSSPSTTTYNPTQQVKDAQPANLESGKPLEDSSGPHGKISFGTWLIILGYMGFSLVLVMSDELFPFWASTATTGGGLGYQSEDIGTLNSMMGIVLILAQLTLFSPLQRRYGTLTLFRWAFVLYIPPFAALPYAKVFLDHNHPLIAWLTLVLLFSIRTLITIVAFTSFNILLPESCENKAILGQVNGLSQALASLMRGIGPYMCGMLWAWSLTNESHFPFDYHFTFIVISIASLFTFFVTTWIRPGMVAF